MFRRAFIALQGKGASKVPPLTVSMMPGGNTYRMNGIGPLERSRLLKMGNWNAKDYPEGAIFAGHAPFRARMYHEAIKQKRNPAEYGRGSRPGKTGSTAQKMFPHTALRTIMTKRNYNAFTTTTYYLLHEKHGQRLAIVENEFGEVSVDDGLVLRTNEEVIEMLNGCICCMVRDDLIVALKRLVETKRDKFDAIIIETTGLADPAPIAQTFFVDEDMKRLFVLDAIVTSSTASILQATCTKSSLRGWRTRPSSRLLFADVLVLNKTDLVTPTELAALKERLKAINNGAKMLEAQHSRVPIKEVFGIRAFDLDKTLAMEANFLDTGAEHKHDTSVSSVGVCIKGEFIPDHGLTPADSTTT